MLPPRHRELLVSTGALALDSNEVLQVLLRKGVGWQCRLLPTHQPQWVHWHDRGISASTVSHRLPSAVTWRSGYWCCCSWRDERTSTSGTTGRLWSGRGQQSKQSKKYRWKQGGKPRFVQSVLQTGGFQRRNWPTVATDGNERRCSRQLLFV